MSNMTAIILSRTIAFIVLVVGMLWLTPSATMVQRDALLRVEDFPECFGGTTTKQVKGGVTLTRTKLHVDAGCNYMPGGRRIPLDEAHSRILLHPSRRQNGAYCVVTLTFEAPPGKFVTESNWIPDNGQGCLELSPLVLPDVRQWAKDNNITLTGATHYFIKIRVQPWDKEGPALTFSRIVAQPVTTK